MAIRKFGTHLYNFFNIMVAQYIVDNGGGSITIPMERAPSLCERTPTYY